MTEVSSKLLYGSMFFYLERRLQLDFKWGMVGIMKIVKK